MNVRTLCYSLLLFLAARPYPLAAQEVAAALAPPSLPAETTTPEAEAKEADEPAFQLSGSADVYFRTNLNAPNVADGAAVIPPTAFADRPGFSLGMINVVGTWETDRSGVVADLVVGPRGEEAVFASTAPANLVNQLYVWYRPTERLTLTLGNFNTFVGYEVIAPTGNFHYSTSYLFSYGPFSHTGLKADLALGDDLSLMVGLFNPTDLTEFNPLGTWSVGAQLGYKGIYLNLLYGDQDGKLDAATASEGDASAGPLLQADLTAGFDLSDKWYVGLNASINTTRPGEQWSSGRRVAVEGTPNGYAGMAAYLEYRLSANAALGLRGEYFTETEGGYGAIGQYDTEGRASVTAFTLSGNIALGPLTLIPELRADRASQPVFYDADHQPADVLASFLLAAVYGF